MKTLLTLLLLITGGVAFFFYQSKTDLETALQAAAEKHAAEVATAREETREAIEHSTHLGEQVAALQEQLAESRTNSVTDELLARQMDREQTAAVLASAQAAEAAAAQAEAEKQAQRERALAIYNRNKAQIDAERAKVAAALTTARAALKAKQDNKPEFDEHGRSYRNGKWVNTGVRMSAADRAEVIAKYETALARDAARLAVSEAEMVRIDGRADELEKAYAAELERLR